MGCRWFPSPGDGDTICSPAASRSYSPADILPFFLILLYLRVNMRVYARTGGLFGPFLRGEGEGLLSVV